MNLQISSYATGKRFVSCMTELTFQNVPTWSSADEHPPLSPRTALNIATKLFTSHIDCKGSWWVLKDICLQPVRDDIWIYQVEFVMRRMGGGPKPNFIAVVLLDGTPIEPVILPDTEDQMII